ncbi:uncharacterized protein MYCFIDRAFT_181960 [Pseudocercospora fijiensis CIRAD86]|uniref:Uncharacterized protein n=1 Tax=Pseudocercospora fijiensis (strain CIRAD86) TaxID=383855 RepID=M3BB59_PSEFD|nr:uncharacterized protein MYCFIDRAFT_181960 [Pseudocercospora fijiensis CIRAD86]EME86453.1 hypothetical protein MYCFIDRAFT_181960 [Pseudocercospora fijiensis CIRAD86]
MLLALLILICLHARLFFLILIDMTTSYFILSLSIAMFSRGVSPSLFAPFSG